MIRIAITAAAHDAHLARRWPHPRRSNRPMRLMNLPSRERPPMASPNAKCRNPRPSCSLWVAAEGPKRSFVLRAVGSYRRSSKAAAISVVLRTRSLGEHDQKGPRLDRRRLKKKVERHRGSRVGKRGVQIERVAHLSSSSIAINLRPPGAPNSLCFFLPVSCDFLPTSASGEAEAR
jgi:hypothetical protein